MTHSHHSGVLYAVEKTEERPRRSGGWWGVSETKWTHTELRELFGSLVSDDLLGAYRKLLATEICPKNEAERFFGDRGIVNALTAAGMAYLRPHGPTSPAGYVAACPLLALAGLLKDRQTYVLNELESIIDGHRRLGSTPTPIEVDISGGGVSQLVQIAMDRAEIARLAGTLMNAARKDYMTLDNLLTEMPFDEEEYANVPLPSFRGSVRCRSIYDAAVAEHQTAVDAVHACMAGGEEARLLPSVPMKMQLADEQFALLPLTPTGTSGAILISAPVIVVELRRHFEMLWEQAMPFDNPTAPPDFPLTNAHRALLGLLAAGLKDEAIGRRLGVSTTTVRRYVGELERALDVQTRPAALLAAYRRGWFGQDMQVKVRAHT